MIPFRGTLRSLLLLWMMLLVSSSASVLSDAYSGDNDNDHQNDTVAVECSATQREFVAATDLTLEGPDEFLDSVQRRLLETALVDLYNQLSQRNCDSYFRRLKSLELTEMRLPSQNKTILASDGLALAFLDDRRNDTPGGGLLPGGEEPPPPPPSEDGFLPGGLGESLPENLPGGLETVVESLPENLPGGMLEDLPLNKPSVPNNDNRPNLPGPFGRRTLQEDVNATTSTTYSTELSYQVIGTCRDCPLTDSGSFALYDDSFRLRGRLLRMRMRVLEVRSTLPLGGGDGEGLLSSNNTTLGRNKDDCTCPAGLRPTRPQPPQVAQLLEVVNQRLDRIQQDRPEGGFLSGRLTAIQQVPVPEQESTPGTTTVVSKESSGGV